MKSATLLLLLAVAPSLAGGVSRSPIERARINDNRRPAGTLRRGVLTLQLEARVADWHPDADDGPGAAVQAFAERGRAPEIPGPLVRVPAGTVVDLTIRNAVPDRVLVVHGLSSRPAGGGTEAPDSIRLPSGDTRRVRFRLDAPGTYYYWGSTTGRRLGNRFHEDGQLTGAIVVDAVRASGGSSAPRRDRVLVMGMMADTMGSENLHEDREHLLYVINGRAWPHTERLSYALGDTIVWRVVNTTADPHPMHLHGAYFRVDSRGDGAGDTTYAPDRRDLVVTELMRGGTTMTMSWSPVHEGNWLFHCHIPEHFGPRGPLGSMRPSHTSAHAMTNHALEGMGGLVMGVAVRSPRATAAAAAAAPAAGPYRRLRLLVRANAGSTADLPFYGATLHEGGGPEPAADSGFRVGVPIVLVRGQPVSIMVVNRTDAPTAIHWHGIELESYNDGVAGFSGTARRLSPIVAPGDSFEARFTPPRAGTFMYHTHVDESRQQRAGLAGALLVLEPGQRYDSTTDLPILISSPSDEKREPHRLLINGSLTPPPLELRRDVRYRLRFANISTRRPGIRVEMARDSALATWTPLAKDGADLPQARRVARPARQPISIGETADVEVTPTSTGSSRLEIRAASGALLGSAEIHVR